MGRDVVKKELPLQVNLDRLLEAKKEDVGLELDTMYEFSWLASDALEKIMRWHKYAAKNKALGFSKWGEYFPETVLGHIFQKFSFGARMMAEEKLYGAHPELYANADVLFLAFAIYGYGVALRGDVAMMDRSKQDFEAEKADFEKILKVNDRKTRDYIRRAYNISKEREEARFSNPVQQLSEISITGKFLWADVVATAWGKGLCEVGRGNLAFIEVFHNMWYDAEYLCRVFPSLDQLVKPKMGRITELMKKYPRWEKK